MNKAEESKVSILIVEGKKGSDDHIDSALRISGFSRIATVRNREKVLPLISQGKTDVVILNDVAPPKEELELIKAIAQNFPQVPVIVIATTDELEMAVASVKAGAFDYLAQPVYKSRLLSCVEKARKDFIHQKETVSSKESLLTQVPENDAAFSHIVTATKKMGEIFHYIKLIAPSNQPVLIRGETGTGKELIAQAIHSVSARKGSFVAVNSAGLDDHMFSDTLFGHRKGAFTGAERDRTGLIGSAAEGSLFLDEIGDLQESSQIKMLRLLQEHEYYPVGSDIPKKSRARIIAAINRDPKELAAKGLFRKDLYFRLCIHQIDLPPLRERPEDLPVLVEHFLIKASKIFHKVKPDVSPELIALLSAYQFPGNIRELEAMVFDAVARHLSGVLPIKTFKRHIRQHESTVAPTSKPVFAEKESLLDNEGKFPTLKQAENFLVEEAMRLAENNQGKAASMLGISRQALNKRINKK